MSGANAPSPDAVFGAGGRAVCGGIHSGGAGVDRGGGFSYSPGGMNTAMLQQLGVSLLLGLLVGLQRERARATLAGIRTFALLTVCGTVCAWLGGWVVVAGLAVVGGLFATGYFARARGGDPETGLTTEVAGVLMFALGAYLATGPLPVAVVCGGAVAVMLQWKQPLHEFVRGLDERDVAAIMQFVLITLVILPVLPNRPFGPFAVLNPFQIWLLVVLIVGLNLTGYVVYKLVGHRAGTILNGVLGGLVSSTATTVTFARRPTGAAALVILLASTVMYARLLVVIGTVAPDRFVDLAAPIAIMLALCLAIAAATFRRERAEQSEAAPHGNPAELKYALGFAALFAFLLLVVAAVKNTFGTSGLYVVAGISGLPDVDALTLSTLQLLNSGRLDTATGWRLIVLASLANFVFKAGIVAALGSRQLFQNIAVRFGLVILGGIALMLFWPR